MVAVKDIQIEQMNYLQNWIEQLNPLAAFPSIAMLFLIASIAGWYVGNLIQWFRRLQPRRPMEATKNALICSPGD